MIRGQVFSKQLVVASRRQTMRLYRFRLYSKRNQRKKANIGEYVPTPIYTYYHVVYIDMVMR